MKYCYIKCVIHFAVHASNLGIWDQAVIFPNFVNIFSVIYKLNFIDG